MEMVFIIALFAGIFFCSNILWHGEWSWCSRYLLAVLHFCIIPVGALFNAISEFHTKLYLSIIFVKGIVV